MTLANSQSPSPIVMKYEIISHKDPYILEVQTKGVINNSDFKKMVTEMNQIVIDTGCTKLLYNNVGANVSDLSIEEIKIIAADTQVFNHSLADGKIASLMVNKLNYGIGRMWHSFMAPDMQFDFQIFNKYRNAMNWLRND